MSKTIRFIKTKVENDNTFLIMSKCNLCPYGFFTEVGKTLLCSYALNRQTIVMSKLEISRKKLFITTFQDVEIPSWCNLSKNLGDEMKRNTLTYRYCGMLMEVASEYNKQTEKPIFESNIEMGSSDILKYTSKHKKYLVYKEKFDKKISIRNKNKENITNTNTNINTTVPYKFPTYQQPYIIKDDVCSCCGEREETVDREINNGMCSECSKNYYNNNEIEYKSFINNFRLKRKISFIDKEFKKIKI